MKTSTSCLSLLTGLALATPVLAQDDSSSGFSFEEIVVTAQKREQTLTEVPVAVSVLGSEKIEKSFSPNIESLQTLVPSVSFRKGTTSANSALTVRGIGTISFSGAAEPSVSTVVDGVVLARSGQAFSALYDIERIEVLRGPQGTLFGKNASAGVVNITTSRPSSEFEGYIDATYAEGNEWALRGKVSGPLGDNVNASLVAMKSEYAGNITNVYNNEKVNGYSRTGLRGMIEFLPSDTLSMLAIVEHTKSDDDCCADLEVLPSGRNPDSAAAPDSDGIVDGVADLDLDQRMVDHDYETRMLDETTAGSLEINKEFENHTVTSISAFRKWENTEYREGDFTSIGGTSTTPVFAVPFLLHDVGTRTWDQFSQELRLTSSGEDRLFYQVGFYYFDLNQEADFTRAASCQNNGGQNQSILDANPGLTCGANDIVSATGYSSVDIQSWALFGQATYDITEDGLSLILGMRYTDDSVSFDHRRVNNDPYGRQGVGVRPALPNSQFSEESGGYATDFTNSSDNTNFSFKAGLSYNLEENGSVYATYSQGYKGPAFNVFYNMGTNDQLPIDEETSDAFEIGYKYASSDILLNIAAYYAEISGFQANNFDNSTGVTITRLTNAGKVSTKGVEVDLQWNVSNSLALTASAALNDAQIEEFNCPVDPLTNEPPAGCTDRSGLDLLFSPDFNYTFGANYVTPVADGDMVFNLTWAHVDEQNSLLPSTSGEFSPVSRLPGYDMLDLSVSYEFGDGAYRVTGFVKNLLDDSFVTTYSGDNFRYQIPREADRYFGLNFRANFN